MIITPVQKIIFKCNINSNVLWEIYVPITIHLLVIVPGGVAAESKEAPFEEACLTTNICNNETTLFPGSHLALPSEAFSVDPLPTEGMAAVQPRLIGVV